MTHFPVSYDFDETIPFWKTWRFRLIALAAGAGLLAVILMGWI